MTKEIKLGRQARDFQAADIQIRDAGTDAGAISFSLSSETPVSRWYGTEILDHSAGAVRLDRLNAGAMPLLFNHDWNDPIGMIDAGRLADGRLVVDAHFFDTERAREVAAMVRGGLKNVSIGYEVSVFEEDVKTNTYTAVDWMPLEGSIVTVPADISVGLGRQNPEAAPVRVVTKNPPEPGTARRKDIEMSEVATPPAGTSAENQARGADSVAMERLRIKTLTDLGRQHKVDEATVRAWIDDEAVTPDQAARNVLDILLARGGNRTGQNPAEIGLSKREASQYSVFKAVRAILNKGDWSKAGLELEAHQEIQRRMGGNPINEHTFYVPVEAQSAKRHRASRDMTVAGASGSQYLVSTENVSFIDLLRNRSVVMTMGAMRMGGLVGNITIPKQTADPTAYWLASESTAITEGQPTIGQLAMSPKHVGAYTEISRLLSLQSSPDAESLVMNSLAASIGLAIDSAAINGSGASGQPTGVINTSGVGSVTGTTMAFAGMLEFQTDIGNALHAAGNHGYVTTGAVAALLAARVKFSNTASPLWNGSILNADACGFPGMSSAQVPAATIIFGAWDQLVIAEWGSLAIEVNPFANFQAGIVGVRGLYAVDIGVRVPSAFSVASSVT